MDKTNMCGKCRWYLSEFKDDQTVQRGKCHCKCPQIAMVKGKIKHYYPIVAETDIGCGDFELED